MRRGLNEQSSRREGRRSSVRRLLTHLFWWVVPAVAALAVVAYIALAILWHVNPPIVPVEGVSMRPTLQAGDLVLLKGVDPKLLRKGDIIAVRVPADARSQYGLPGEVVHRIVRINNTPNGLTFVTKGDANAGNDVFPTPASSVVGREVTSVPGLGYPFLFFRSRQGYIFLGACLLVGVLYFLVGVYEERRAYAEGTAVTMQTILDETRGLRDRISSDEDRPRAIPPGADAGSRAPPAVPEVAPVITQQGAPVHSPELDDLLEEVRDSTIRSKETAEVMRELVGAIGEYGEHLRSHTEVMVQLAATTGELHKATAEMREAIASSAAASHENVAPAADEVEQAAEADAVPPAPEVSEQPAPDAEPPAGLKRVLGGYSRESVEAVIGELSQALAGIRDRLAELERHNTELLHANEWGSAERDALRRELDAHRERARSSAAATSLAREQAETIKREAAQEASRVVDAALAAAVALIRQARDEADRARSEPGAH